MFAICESNFYIRFTLCSIFPTSMLGVRHCFLYCHCTAPRLKRCASIQCPVCLSGCIVVQLLLYITVENPIIRYTFSHGVHSSPSDPSLVRRENMTFQELLWTFCEFNVSNRHTAGRLMGKDAPLFAVLYT